MGEIGFESLADLSDLAGDYVLGVEVSKGERKWACAQVVPVHVDRLLNSGTSR
jgi:hypothetical protein